MDIEIHMNAESEKIVPENESFLAGKIVKVVIIFIVSVSLVVGTFFLEGFLAEGSGISQLDSELFTSDVVVRFDESYESVPSISPILSNVVNFSGGKIWANFSFSTHDSAIQIGRIVVIPNSAIFDLEYDGKKMKLSVFGGDVYVGFMPEGTTLDAWHDPYDDFFVNKMLVPRGRQIQVNFDKLDDRYDRLLYTKLVKELKYSVIPGSSRDSEWVKSNMIEDDKVFTSRRQDAISKILHRGTSVNEGALGRFIFWSEENLTFVPSKKKEIVFEHLFNYLNDAIYHLTDVDEESYLVSLKGFDTYFSILPREFQESDEFHSRFDSYLDELSLFAVDDAQYKAYVDLLQRKFDSGHDRFDVVNETWLDVYSGFELNTVVAEDSLNTYYQYFDQTLGEISDGDHYLYYVTFNNQLFDNLLLSTHLFYKDGYFAMKNVIEQELVGLYADGQLKDELKQSLISTKLTFLKRLIAHFFDGKLEVAETKTILSRLVEEIEDLMPKSSDSDVAVVDLFESELEDIGNFWGYLNSPEYHSSKSYGTTHKARYQSYLEEKDKLWSFVNIREDVLGEVDSDFTVADVKTEVKAAFSDSLLISGLKIGEITDVDQRYVDIKADVNGFPIEAKFDRDNGLIKEVYSYGELVSDRAVPLESLSNILANKFVDPKDDLSVSSEDSVAVSEETYAQRFARNFVAKKVREAGFVLEIDNVEMVDESNVVFRLKEIGVPEKSEVKVTFDFTMSGEIVTNLFVSISGESVVLDGEYTLDEVKGIALADDALNAESASVSSASPISDIGATTAVADEEAAVLKDLQDLGGISR